MSILVIVESPGKIKKMRGILGKGYIVEASVGHILELKKGYIPTPTTDFEPKYEPIADKKKVIATLKKLGKKASDLILMCDNDREGEQIAWSVAHVMGIKNPKKIVFRSITKTAIMEGLKNIVPLDENLIDAQKARRALDRIVGFELSPLLWSNVGMGLSAGRVQSVVVRLIIDKENEIRDFMDKGAASYFKFTGTFFSKKKTFKTNMYRLKSTNDILKGALAKINTEPESRKILTKCMKSKFNVEHVYDKKKTKNPSAPYTTSTLQQDASRKYGFSVKRTMMTAQHLYEAGHITYMRTDSVTLSKEAMDGIKKYVLSKYGKKYYKGKQYAAKAKHIQEAHEAVRPTHVEHTTVNTGGKVKSDEKKLYLLIWKRTVASQMTPALYNVTTIQISVTKLPNYYFETSLDKLLFPGFLKVYNITDTDDDSDEESEFTISIPDPGTKLTIDTIITKQTYNQPPSRYSEPSLINKLDPKNLNIGRPSTSASIIEKIKNRGYVVVEDVPGLEKDILTMTWDGEDEIEDEISKTLVGKENKKFVPTPIGYVVTDFLMKGFPKILDYKFTASMENDLDKIANGQADWLKVMKKFYKTFHPQVEKLQKIGKIKRVLGRDPKTGYNVISTSARYGPIVKVDAPKKADVRTGPIKYPLTMDNITLKDALKILEYPKFLGIFEKKNVYLQKGKYGLYLKHGTGKKTKNYPVKDDNITLKDAIKAIEAKRKEDENRQEEFKKSVLAEFKSDKKLYTVLPGKKQKDKKWNDYIKITLLTGKGKPRNIPLPKHTNIKQLTLEKVEEIETKYYERKSKRGGKKNTKKFTKKTTRKTTKKTTRKATKKTTKKAIKKAIKKSIKKKVVKKN